jgi:hypothetical protein
LKAANSASAVALLAPFYAYVYVQMRNKQSLNSEIIIYQKPVILISCIYVDITYISLTPPKGQDKLSWDHESHRQQPVCTGKIRQHIKSTGQNLTISDMAQV